MARRFGQALRASAMLVLAGVAILAAPADRAVAGDTTASLGGSSAIDERSVYAVVGEPTRPPIGWVEFCIEYKPECATQPSCAARRRAHAEGLERHRQGQQLGQSTHQADHRHRTLGRGRALELSRRRLRRLRGLRPAQAAHADAGRLAARGAAHHRGARQEGRRPCRAHGQDRQGRIHSRQSGTAGPALVQDRLPLREAAVAERSEHVGLARRTAPTAPATVSAR